ncbi:MAG: hypothetical protein HC911_13835 [Chloroflexaceae bacterium]|nr:hypothetical protein [Chloroflexaceae bacterium]
MAPLFPAILLCGPPHSGKSILFYRLSQALREKGIDHYSLRASPDGEGDWTYEAEPQLVRHLRMRSKADWTPAFAQQISREIEQRMLPLLVDTGGQITPESAHIAASCTHGIIISRDLQAIGAWRDLLTEQGCIVLAELHSQLDGEQQIVQPVMPLRGTLTGLHPKQDSRGGCFSALLELIVAHMNYAPDELFRAHERAAARDWVVHLGQPLLPSQTPNPPVHWNPHDIPELLAGIVPSEPLALYGRAPVWLYAALAHFTQPVPILFTPTRGWVEPPPLVSVATPTLAALHWQQQRIAALDDAIWLQFDIPTAYLDHDPTMPLDVPALPANTGIILDGKLPTWLYAGLVRHYTHAAWLAVVQPKLGAIVVASQHTDYPLGRVLHLPFDAS